MNTSELKYSIFDTVNSINDSNQLQQILESVKQILINVSVQKENPIQILDLKNIENGSDPLAESMRMGYSIPLDTDYDNIKWQYLQEKYRL
ncbi:MAG: hypothetical protein IJ180_10945 [Bacteroidales bacterium]|nr:hypothetical protein [Bacteroidales bacterium]